MVAFPGYDHIVYFSEVPVGRSFASSKTGRAFVKTSKTSWKRDPHCDRIGDYGPELFEDKTLVYLGALYERVLY